MLKVANITLKCEKCTCLARENVFTPSGEQMYSGKKFMFFAEKTTNNHPTTQTDLHPIPKAGIISEPSPKVSVCLAVAHLE